MELSSLFSLGVYLAQQLGILLGVGAELVLLCSYLLHVHTPGARAVVPVAERVQRLGLVLVVVSGLGAVALHASLGAWTVLEAPAFIFKWILVAAMVGLSTIDEWSQTLSPRAAATIRGVGGAQWFAVLIVHTMAPVVMWPLLLSIYAGWTVVFMLGWTAFVHVLMPKKYAALKKATVPPVVAAAPAPKVVVPKPVVPPPAPKAAPMPPPAPKVIPKPAPPAPVAVPKATHDTLPVVVLKDLPQPAKAVTTPAPAAAPKPVVPAAPAPKPPVAAAPAPKPPVVAAPAPKPPQEFKDDAPAVPAIYVMPRTPEEVGTQNRGGVVQFD